MKKVLAIVFLVVMLVDCSFALAEIPDITGLSVDELYLLQETIIKELGDRKQLPSFTAPNGVYEAGKDFPVGKYLITSPNYCTYITVFESMQTYNSGKPLLKKDTLYQGESKVVEFTEGMVVFVDFNNARFEPYKGLSFE